MSDEPILGRYQPIELVAVGWSPEMAARFPNADHNGCRQEGRLGDDGWEPFDPPRCQGWHCNRCGSPTNAWGHHSCPDRPESDGAK